MNFRIGKKELIDALSLCSRALSSTTPLPALSGIKFSIENDILTLTSSDSNISIQTKINAKDDDNTLTIFEEGNVVIDGKFINEIVRKIDSDTVNIEVFDKTFVQISGGNSQFKLNGMNGDDYPYINFNIENKEPFKLKTELLEEIISETAFACSDKETKPVLTGINMKAKDNILSINATDSYRLASKIIEIDKDLNFDITIPAKYLSEVVHSISSEDEVIVTIDNQKISFTFGNTIIETRLLDDEFPDTSALIRINSNEKLVINAKDLINALDRTLFIKSDGKNTVKLDINSSRLQLTSSGQDGVSSFEELNVIDFEGNDLEISCSGKYLLDAIKAMKCDEITISFSGETKPLIVRKKDGDNSLVQMISPVRTYR